MTAQEVFDKVATHLLTQNKRSLREEFGFVNGCAYRGDSNLKCAAGCLIPDEEYDEAMEGAGIMVQAGRPCSLATSILIKRGYKDHLGLISTLQTVHDTTDPTEWGYELKRVASLTGLKTDVLQAFESSK